MVERNKNEVIGQKLASFESSLALESGLDTRKNRTNNNSCLEKRRSMSLTDVCQFSDHELLLRKDSGESGFLEFDAEFEDEINKCVPDSFDLLPPLEQRRQNVSVNISSATIRPFFCIILFPAFVYVSIIA